MSPFTAGVAVRRLLAKRPWLYWLVVGAAALGVAASMLERSDRIDDARDAWGETTTVWVATRSLAPGDPVLAEAREVPVAVAPPQHVVSVDGLTMRQHVGPGEIIAERDVAAGTGPQAITPPGWLAVAIVESPASGAAVGDGVVISTDALVVGLHDDVTVLAVPANEAALVPAAAAAGTATLLLVP
ncbi:MAG: hypothetical protein WKF60_01810 [Ilumatobacter sp.]